MPDPGVHFMVTLPLNPQQKLYRLSDEIYAGGEVGDSFGRWFPSGSSAWG